MLSEKIIPAAINRPNLKRFDLKRVMDALAKTAK
jgi:hypothetical protein